MTTAVTLTSDIVANTSGSTHSRSFLSTKLKYLTELTETNATHYSNHTTTQNLFIHQCSKTSTHTVQEKTVESRNESAALGHRVGKHSSVRQGLYEYSGTSCRT